MTALVRYTGPTRAHVGAIGLAADGGVMLAGRLVRGNVEPASIWALGVWWSSWDEARDVLAAWLEPTDIAAAIRVRQASPDPAGLEVVAGDAIYRLIVGTDSG